MTKSYINHSLVLETSKTKTSDEDKIGAGDWFFLSFRVLRVEVIKEIETKESFHLKFLLKIVSFP